MGLRRFLTVAVAHVNRHADGYLRDFRLHTFLRFRAAVDRPNMARAVPGDVGQYAFTFRVVTLHAL